MDNERLVRLMSRWNHPQTLLELIHDFESRPESLAIEEEMSFSSNVLKSGEDAGLLAVVEQYLGSFHLPEEIISALQSYLELKKQSGQGAPVITGEARSWLLSRKFDGRVTVSSSQSENGPEKVVLLLIGEAGVLRTMSDPLKALISLLGGYRSQWKMMLETTPPDFRSRIEMRAEYRDPLVVYLHNLAAEYYGFSVRSPIKWNPEPGSFGTSTHRSGTNLVGRPPFEKDSIDRSASLTSSEVRHRYCFRQEREESGSTLWF